MGRLVEALAADLDGVEVRTGAEVLGLDHRGAFAVRTADGPLDAGAVVLAVPAPAARILVSSLRPAGPPTPEVPFSSSTVVHLRYPEGALGRALDGAGWVAASEEPGAVSACSWVTAKWPHLEERGAHLRAVVTGAAASEGGLEERVVDEVGTVMGAAARPDVVRLHRWEQALPSYPVGHRRRVRALRTALPRGVGVAGASYDGVGIPDCVASGEGAAHGLLRHLGVAGPGGDG
jgi:oxygen-dependent protoporphyrinogen oxidase